MRFSRLALSTILVFLVSCGVQQHRTPSVGQAYVGPTTLELHKDFNPKSPLSATVHHGESLEIVEYKRRFIKVRTAGGIEGWTDMRQLLSTGQMAELQRMAKQTAQFPSQGMASTSEMVNVHTEPNRASPSFLQVAEGSKLEVIGHRVTLRTQALPAVPLPPPKPRGTRRKSKERAGSSKIPPPPMPPAPKPPVNWQALSKTNPAAAAPTDAKRSPKQAPVAVAPAPVDDWNLVRTADGKVGWVLTRMLNMGIPEEVAQYAEGHRITSYFAMGNVQDEGQLKHNWLWTTIRKGSVPYEYDNFRFFIWSRKHHRYETVYIERDVVGHYPVEVETSGANPAFTLILDDDNGSRWRRKYVFNGYRVNRVDTAPYTAPTQDSAPTGAVAGSKPVAAPQPWYSAMKQKFSQMFHR